MIPFCVETAFLAQFAAYSNEEGRSQPSSLKEGLEENGPHANPLYDQSMVSQLECPQSGRGPGPTAELFAEDYDSPKLQTHGPLYSEAGGAEEMGLPSFNQVGGGMPPPDTSDTPIVLEDSFLTRTEPQPFDRTSVTDEMKDQVTGLNDIPTSSKFEMRSRHSSGNSAKSQPSLTPAPTASRLVRNYSSHSKVGRKTSGLRTEHELARFDSRAHTNCKGRVRQGRYKSVYLDEGEQHRVWVPRLHTDVELPQPPIALSQPSLNHSLSMTDMHGKQVSQQLTSPDPVKNLVANRKRLESRVKAAQEVGRQVSGEAWPHAL